MTSSMDQRRARGVTRARFGTLPTGEPVEAYTLADGCGHDMTVITLGAVITSLRVPDRHGRSDDVVLGHDTVAGYLDASPYFGAVVGRFANRIAHGRFALDGETHQLATNDGAHHLHGGRRGFDKVLWTASTLAEGLGVALRYESRDGEEGYPGALAATVTYRLSDGGELSIDYEATTGRATPVNLTQHSYWNLGGTSCADVLRHELTIFADEFTPSDATLIPTGEIVRVAGTPFDFRAPRAVGANIAEDDEQLRRAGGYDHNFVLRAADGGGLRHAARLYEPASGRTMDVHTTEPGLQFYSGNFLDGSIRGKDGRAYGHRAGLCLETQHFPDSPNRPHFPSPILRPGERYRSSTRIAFGIS